MNIENTSARFNIDNGLYTSKCVLFEYDTYMFSWCKYFLQLNTEQS